MANETLHALKDSKRVVELKFQNSLLDKSKLDNKVESLTQQTELLQVKNCSLEERLETLESEKHEQTLILAELQQNLVERTSFYESQIRDMQIELNCRVEEINLTRVEDVEKVRDQYVQLFNEKAAELMEVRAELETCQAELVCSGRKLSDLEYREQELNDIINKMRENPDHQSVLNSTNLKLEQYVKNSELLHAKFKEIHNEFNLVKTKDAENLHKLTKELCDMQAKLDKRDREILNLEQKINAFTQCVQ